MEKNRSLRVASGLFILVLLTICVIATTFAKYTTTGSATDIARVAKWGVTVEASGNAFATQYDTTDTSVARTIAQSVVTATGTDVDGKKLVAPGTSGTLLDTSITGTPEVAVKVSTNATLTLTGWTIDSGEYCPIVITIDGTEYKMGTTADPTKHVYATISDFKSAVEGALNNGVNGVNVQPNTDLATTYNHTVTWAWNFEDDGANPYQTNEKDTALGNLTTAPTIQFEYTATVTQID